MNSKLIDDYYNHSAVSNSDLSFINPEEGGSFEKFKDRKNIKYESSALEFGSALHKLVLEPEKYKLKLLDISSGLPVLKLAKAKYNESTSINECVLEAAKELNYQPNYKWDTILNKLLTPSAIEYIMDKSNAVYLQKEDYDKINYCIDSVLQSPASQYFFETNKIVEQSIYNYYDIDGFSIPTKCKPDLLIDYGNYMLLIDLKSTSSALTNFAFKYELDYVDNELKSVRKPGSFWKYRYYRQLAYYKHFVEKKYDKPVMCKLVVVETVDKYKSGVFNITDNTLEIGEKEFKYLLELVKECMLSTTPESNEFYI